MVIASTLNRRFKIGIILLLLTLLAAGEFLYHYIRPGLNLTLCLILLPFVMRVSQPGIYSHRYGWWATVCLLGFLLLHIRGLFFFSIGFTLLFIIENWKGKTGWLPAVLVLLFSSIPRYITDVFTFSLRIRMSELSGDILQWAGFQVEVSGNVFLLDGMAFSVDEACMGLNSIITGLILITLASAYGENRYGRSFRFWPLLGIYLLGGIMMIAGNQIRMIVLVLFRSPPETMGHELIGLACLIAYGVVPFWFLIRWMLQRGFGSTQFYLNSHSEKSCPKLTWLWTLGLIGSIAWYNIFVGQFNFSEKDFALESTTFPGFERTIVEGGIAKFENDFALVYIKPPVSFIRSEHNPSLCWRASGYQLQHIREEEIAGQTLLRAEFHKGGDVLHTAWWFDNGNHRTHSQLTWRWESLKGAAPYRLVNVTVADARELEQWCRVFLSKDWHEP
ncbi:MAG: exosortase N [Bacteroidota bacterium]